MKEEFDFTQIPPNLMRYDAVSVGNPERMRLVSQSVSAFETISKWLCEAESAEFNESFVVEQNGFSEFFGGTDYEYSVRALCPNVRIPKQALDLLIRYLPGFATAFICVLAKGLIYWGAMYDDVAITADDNHRETNDLISDSTERLVFEHACLLWHQKVCEAIVDPDGFNVYLLGERVSDIVDRIGEGIMSAIVRRVFVHSASPLSEEENFPAFSAEMDGNEVILSVELPLIGLQFKRSDLELIKNGFPDNGFITLHKKDEDSLVLEFHFQAE